MRVVSAPQGVHGGAHGVPLGDPQAPCDQAPVGQNWIEQQVDVPDVAAPMLSLWYRIFTYDRNLVEDYNFLEIRVDDNSLQRFANRTGDYGCLKPLHDLGWRQYRFDLSDYRGQRVRLVSTDHWFNTWAYLHDVQVGGSD